MQVQAVENRGVVRGQDNLLVVLFGKFGQLAQQFGAQFGIQRSVYIVYGEKTRRFLCDKKREVKEQKQKAALLLLTA